MNGKVIGDIMLNIYVMILGLMMIFGKGTTEEIQTVNVNDTRVVHIKSKSYSKEDYLFSRELTNGDFVVFTEIYNDTYRIRQTEGLAGLKASFDSNKEIKMYVNGEELTEDKIRTMDSSTIRIYEDFLMGMTNELDLH